MRITPDGRMRFSPWSYVDLEHVSLKVVTDSTITVLCAGTPVMYLFPERNRILSACFLATLQPDQLRMAVADLRDARDGLDSWVVPALEFNYGWRDVRGDPALSEVILDLLASCRDLPVAQKWQRVRARYFANCGTTPPELPATKNTPARKPRVEASRGTQPRKTKRESS
ncbi:MAG TPA: hypothetical protein VK447_04235 [Myxococcaceae bacterium]|nr:hypothetical protein [Myxococcaceae bacterium]